VGELGSDVSDFEEDECSSNETIFCGWPSSAMAKFSGCRPWAGLPFLSVTTMSIEDGARLGFEDGAAVGFSGLAVQPGGLDRDESEEESGCWRGEGRDSAQGEGQGNLPKAALAT
jgi:hypothetical protein